jgi:dUTPase
MHDDYYILGFAFSDAITTDGKVKIVRGKEDREILAEIAAKIANRGGTARLMPENKRFALILDDAKIAEMFGKLDSKRRLPWMSDEYVWSFICGFYDGYGSFRFHPSNPRLFVKSLHTDVINLIADKWEVKTPHADKVQAHGYKAIDICGKMYAKVSLKHPDKFNSYLEILNYIPKRDWMKTETFAYHRLDPKAIAPCKTRVTDSGYDIHALTFEKVKADVYKADTKLAIRPAPGFYFDLIGRSSLPQKGWQFLQGVGVVDRSYRGTLAMHMRKLWPDATMPDLPWKCGQLIPRPIVHAEWQEVKEMDDTDRNTKGFGSTDR